MTKPPNPFRYFDSSPEVIRLVVMMYVRYPLSLHNVEDLLFERGIDICHETVRLWWNRFGPIIAGEIRRKRVQHMRAYTHWKWHLDEVYVKIPGLKFPTLTLRRPRTERSWARRFSNRRPARDEQRGGDSYALYACGHSFGSLASRISGLPCGRWSDPPVAGGCRHRGDLSVGHGSTSA